MKIILVALFALLPCAASAELTDVQIKKSIIQESIASYSGRCPCPYNAAKNGSLCGGRSAYARKGGAAPLCYDADVTSEMVRAYRETHK